MVYYLLLGMLSIVFFPAGSASAQDKACPDATLSARLPHEVKLRSKQPRQADFDCFSWQSLVALNWPAGKDRGEPDSAKKFGERGRDNLVVWQTYKDPTEVFLPKGKDPCDCKPTVASCLNTCWNKYQTMLQCADGSAPSSDFPHQVSLSKDQAQPTAATLTDQNGNLVAYEILMNRDEFEFIIDNKFYNGEVQRINNRDINLPAGETNGPVGSIEIKAAWKILADNDDKSRFLTRTVRIADNKICNGNAAGQCCVRELGLVGFHIAHKLKPYNQWVWSTFEHVDNAPLDGEKPDSKIKYNFYNPNCKSAAACAANSQHPDVKTPNQIVRLLPKVKEDRSLILPKAVNTQWRALVKGTIWTNYMLVGTQWPTRPSSGTGTPQPTVLANAIMESYIQQDSKCMACHANAKLRSGKHADYSYLFRLGALK